MRIAFIFPRYSGPYGGERLLTKLSNELVKNGHELTVYSAFKDDNFSSIGLDKKITITRIGSINFGCHNLKNLFDFFRMPITAFSIRKDFDLVVGLGWQSTFCLSVLRLIGRYKNKQLVYYCLEPPRFLYDLKEEKLTIKGFIMFPLFSLIKAIDSLSVRKLTNVLAISDWTSDQIFKIYGKKVSIVYPGIEKERFTKITKSKARKSLKISQKVKIFVTVSKIHNRKRIKESVDVYINNKTKDSEYYIIGDGPDMPELREYVDGMKEESIHIIGKVGDAQVTNYIVASDFFIFTAVNEPFGIAPLEAKVAGSKILPNDFDRKIFDWSETGQEFSRQLQIIYQNI